MKRPNLTIFRRFTIVIFSIISILGLLFSIITYLAITNYHQASTQLLNKDVAKHVAEFTAAFTSAGINKKKADSVFKNAMVLNPNTEVYFLDTSGKIIYFHASEKEIRERNIALPPIKKFITARGELYIKGIDPKDPATPKIFSASEVTGEKRSMGYIYIILGSKKLDGIMDILFGSHILNLAITAFITIILLSFIFTFLYLKRTRKNFDQMISVLQRFESGDYNARFEAKKLDEMEPVTHAFNKMADLLSVSISQLTKSEQERKNFIAIISHDLRTPLSIARGYLETLVIKREQGGITQEEQKNYAQLIYGKILQIENMVKQLFELSRMDAVEFRPEKELFVLSEIVLEVVNTFQLMALEKKVSLKCTECTDIQWIKADVGMIERVVQNLVDNALKNTPEGGSIQASLVVDKNKLNFKIENNGPPLPADLLQWIKHFNEEDVWDKRPQKTGLGLLIVQKILYLHQTNLQVSTSGGTNIFAFHLPVYNRLS